MQTLPSGAVLETSVVRPPCGPEPEPEPELEPTVHGLERQQQRHAAALALLPLPPVAQRTQVVRRRGLFSPKEVDQLLRAAEGLNPMCGHFCGTPCVWSQLSELETQPQWETTYLSSGGWCHRHPVLAPALRLLLSTARKVDAEQGWNLLQPRSECGPVSWRNVEYHVVRPGGALADPQHFDGGSLITVDVMLASSSNGDFEGGEFATPEVGAATAGSAGGDELLVHTFERGDALFFLSHKRHGVRPVRAGQRRVMIAELWHGPERHCAHRCLERVKKCDFTLGAARREGLRMQQQGSLHISR